MGHSSRFPFTLPHLVLVTVASLLMKGVQFTLKQGTINWWRAGSFFDFIMDYTREMLRRVGPKGDCYDGSPHEDQETACTCAPIFAAHSVHVYTDLIVVQRRPQVQLIKKERTFGK